MLTLSDIRDTASSRIYRKGLELQSYKLVKNFEYSIFEESDNSVVADMQGELCGDFDTDYTVSAVVDESYSEVREWRCSCEESWDGMCSHCVALLVEYLQKRKAKEVLEIKWKKKEGFSKEFHSKTPMRLKGILKDYSAKSNSKYLIPENIRGKMEFTPYVKCYSKKSMYVDFKVGMEYKYVVKNLMNFIRAVDNCEKVVYGKRLEFCHNAEAFTSVSLNLIDFVRRHQEENMRHSYYRYSMSMDRERGLDLSEAGMEDFLFLMAGEYFEGKLPETEDTVWHVQEEKKKPGMEIKGDGYGITVYLKDSSILYGRNCYFFYENGEIAPSSKRLKSQLGSFFEYLIQEEGHQCYIAQEDLTAFSKEILPLIKELTVLECENFEEEMYLPEKPEFELYVDKMEHDVVAGKVMCIYREHKYNLLEKKGFDGVRDLKEEMRIRSIVESYFEKTDGAEEFFIIQKDENLLYQLISGGLKRLDELMTIYASDAFQNMKVHNSPSVAVGISLKSGLLELTLQSEEVSMEELSYLLGKYNRKKKFIRLKNGDFINLNHDNGLESLADLKEDLMFSDKKIKSGKIDLPMYRAMYLDSSLKDSESLNVEKNKEFKAVVRNMKTIEDSDYEIPGSLKKVMREYQKNGFRWLKTLREYGFGGILADDMGLGKTLQVISLLLSEQQDFKGKGEEQKPSLIVCPASLVYNWKKEMKRFAPSLVPVLVTGAAQERKEQIGGIQPGDVVVTSYDSLKRDVDLYEKHIFAIEVIDEAQYIKNPVTQAANSVKEIHASFKLALTGTPIENRLSELWSIFDYLMPGFLYSYNRFRNDMEIPIVSAGDENKMQRLRRMIRPFVLRRLKTDVLKDLPEKIEENVFSRLEGEQSALYHAHVQKMKIMLEKQNDADFAKGKIEILAELTRLRQICCDPALVFEGYGGESAKMETCMELVAGAVASGHKILLFSQFTSMLDHIKEQFEKSGISYYMLTGSVSKEKRMRMVEDFNIDDTQVFCISLKAGGTGLNLTAADIVIHYDPWWNVAVQNQATDRAYRIGQKNVVTVYKLVTEGTIEEKIIEMQEKKKQLADNVLGGAGMESGSFSREELLELLG